MARHVRHRKAGSCRHGRSKLPGYECGVDAHCRPQPSPDPSPSPVANPAVALQMPNGDVIESCAAALSFFVRGSPSEPSLAEGTCHECLFVAANASAYLHWVRKQTSRELKACLRSNLSTQGFTLFSLVDGARTTCKRRHNTHRCSAASALQASCAMLSYFAPFCPTSSAAAADT